MTTPDRIKSYVHSAFESVEADLVLPQRHLRLSESTPLYWFSKPFPARRYTASPFISEHLPGMN